VKRLAGLLLMAFLGLASARVVKAQASVGGTLYAPGVKTEGAVVFLVPRDAARFTEPRERPIIDQVNLRFSPQVLPLRPGTTVEFRNSDPVLHNVFGLADPGPGFDLGTYPRGELRPHTFAEPGVHVILCNVHPEMVAYVVAVPTTYHSVVDAAGEFFVEAVPAGRYSVNVWHPQIDGFSTQLTVGDRVSGIHLKLEIPE
jgi:plastocyanin